MNELTVTNHAVEQYLNKVSNLVDFDDKTKEKAAKVIARDALKGEEIQLHPSEAVRRLLNNDCKQAKYVWRNGVTFVIVDNCVVTCYPMKKNRFEL